MLRDSMDARQEPLLFRGEPAVLRSYSSQPLTQDTREDLVDSWEQGDWTEVRVVASIPFFYDRGQFATSSYYPGFQISTLLHRSFRAGVPPDRVSGGVDTRAYPYLVWF